MIASALSTALTIYPCQIRVHQRWQSKLQLLTARKKEWRPATTGSSPHAVTCQHCDTHYFSRPNPQPSDRWSDALPVGLPSQPDWWCDFVNFQLWPRVLLVIVCRLKNCVQETAGKPLTILKSSIRSALLRRSSRDHNPSLLSLSLYGLISSRLRGIRAFFTQKATLP